MDRLKWISSAGGPLILGDEKQIKMWSGIFNRNKYINSEIIEAEDFLDAEEADYGKACLVEDYLGLVEILNGKVLILGEEPLSTTSFVSNDNKRAFARWQYGEDEEFIDEHLQKLDFSKINNWQDPIFFEVKSNRQFLFDSALCFLDLQQEEDEYYLELSIEKGNYIIWTAIYNPNNDTELIIHKFEPTE